MFEKVQTNILFSGGKVSKAMDSSNLT